MGTRTRFDSAPLRLRNLAYRDTPIIDLNPGHKRACRRTNKTPEWKSFYNKRTAVERLNGRLTAFYKLNDVRVRGR
jgi:hypothetical protein